MIYPSPYRSPSNPPYRTPPPAKPKRERAKPPWPHWALVGRLATVLSLIAVASVSACGPRGALTGAVAVLEFAGGVVGTAVGIVAAIYGIRLAWIWLWGGAHAVRMTWRSDWE